MSGAAPVGSEVLAQHNERLSTWLKELKDAPPDKLMGISAEEREQLLILKNETVSLKKKLEEVTDEVAQKEKLLQETKLKAERAQRAVETEVAPLERVLEKLEEEEDKLRRQVVQEGRVAGLKEFLERQEGLHHEEEKMKMRLKAAEDELEELRDGLCVINVEKLHPDERKNSAMYIKWKKLLAEKNRQERRYREEKYLSRENEETRREVQLVVAEMEKKAEILSIQTKTEEHEHAIAECQERIKSIQAGMQTAVSAMREFRNEFEQMRVAIMLDKTIKSTQMAALVEHKQRLQRAEQWFEQLMEKESQRIREEEAEKWQARLREARDEAAQALETERQRMHARLQKVKEELGQSYSEGFEPLLRAAQDRFKMAASEARRLQDEVRRKEEMLSEAEAELASINSQVGSQSDVAAQQLNAEEQTEMASLKKELEGLWGELGTPAEEIASFYSELDLATPYNETVYELYRKAEGRLTKALT